MKILIVSDTHRVDDILKKVISIEKPFDMFIHLGDGEGSETKISLMLDPTCACLMVQGNNDFFSQLPAEKEINIKKSQGTPCTRTPVRCKHGHLNTQRRGHRQRL